MNSLLFNGWEPILRTLLVGTLAYLGLILLLRSSGKRTLSKMNAFDLVVTVALGSTLATITISKDVALLQGLVGLGLLIGLQFLVASISVRWGPFNRLIRSQPRLLLFRGQPIPSALHQERVTETELIGAVRKAGGTDLAEVFAVILEADGSLSVLCQPPGSAPAQPVLGNVRGVPDTS